MLGEHFEIISRMTRRDEPPFTFEGQYARVENVVNAPRTGGGDHVRLAIGGHGKNVTMRLAAKYCDEINIDLPADALPEAIALAGRPLRGDRARSRRPSTIVTGTNPAWPYPGLRAIGRQRLMKKEDLPAIMPYDFDNLLPRADEMAQWVELGIDSIICGVPGLVDTDEGVYELLDDLRTAGIALDAGRGERVGPCRSDWSCRRATSTSSRAGSRGAPGRGSSSSPRPPRSSASSRSGPASTSCPSGRASRSPSTAGRCRRAWRRSCRGSGSASIVLNSTFHNPAITAKAASTLDAISGGRLTLGLGAGFKENEAARVRPRLSGAQGPDGVAVGALRDHLAGDPAGEPRLHVQGQVRLGRRT